jgi:hypothetical protein
MDKFTYKGKYFEQSDCYFQVRKYQNGNNALIIEHEEEGRICVCSVNGSKVLNGDEIGIKNWSENEGMDKFLIDMGIIENEPFEYEPSGFIQIPYYKLTKKGLELFEGV